MYRQIIGYIPSNVVPAAVAFIMIYAYTRLLSPEAFGIYTYVFLAILLVQGSLIHSLGMAVIRFYPAASQAGREKPLLGYIYKLFYLLCGLLVAASVGALMLLDWPREDQITIALGVATLLFRSLVQLNQSVNRSATNMRRYNSIECAHAVLGLLLGIAAIEIYGPTASAVMAGLLAAALLCAVCDSRNLVTPFSSAVASLDRAEIVRLAHYAWPLVLVSATMLLMQNTDRFLLGSFVGAGAVGLYAVAYNLVDRPTTLICTSISTATFPLAVQILETQGKAAARVQAGRNSVAVLGVTLPACIGLALTANYTAVCLVGPDFREGVAVLIPIMSLTILGRCLRSHVIDQTFLLAGRPLTMLWVHIPALFINAALNLYLVPRYGMLGAAWAGVACQWMIALASWFIGTSLFPIQLTAGDLMRSIVAVLPMAAGLLLVQFPLNWMGFTCAILWGGLLYTVTAFLLDVGDVRTLSGTMLRRSAMRARLIG